MKFFTKSLLLITLGVSFFASADPEKAPVPASRVKAYEAKVTIPLAGVQPAQVFVRLQNTGDKPVSLVSVTTNAAEQVVIMQVQAARPDAPKIIPSLLLPAKTLVDLHKAGPYLLLKGLKTSLQTGDQLHLQLSFSDNTRIEVTAIAKSAFDQPHHH